ncbi:glycoside hydrolase family 32 protein [Christiangramia sp. SM2212]|uniref:Glycoside hydrolase family 32 protein n=1 Tax=Christiangramia sediminicola TaxID=3073267 RepID=A0ABU1EMK8_9FLAO|nr:glycoside hydrolase family 32 protein [Christiangramia sp. SM2212]MDR5589224.1 glycoside hydrolase family 32 protein [Christiangramia sp. SM2212]
MKRKFQPILLLGLFLFTFNSCKNETEKSENTEDKKMAEVQKDEDFRPNFHFTPEKNWMNDPNGMFYMNGTYHLYFQYYPDDNVWGPMHWGHATSKDMITWEEQEIALYPDEKGYIFSGSAVVDNDNTSGFGEDGKTPVIAIFTYHDPVGAENKEENYQSQAIAYSLDEGMTWTKYEGNPVIPNPGIVDFRDPKVTWDDINKQWLMALATREKTLFYSSQNLKEWKKLSEFGAGTGAHDGVWECPDFFPMRVDGTGETKWVLIQSLNPGGYNGGSGTQYFVGDFDGKTFTPEENMKELEEKHKFWIDFGRDNYAGVTWANVPKEDGRKLFLGWMSNWLYAQEVPTETWRSAMTVARELKLVQEDETYLVKSSPVKELEKYRSSEISKDAIDVDEKAVLLDSSDLDLAKAEVKFSIKDLQETNYKIILSNGNNEEFIVNYDHTAKEFSVDRSNAGQIDFSEKFTEKNSTAPRISDSQDLKVLMILDKTSVEMFFDDGTTVMTEIFFPNQPWTELSLESENEKFSLGDIQAYELKF